MISVIGHELMIPSLCWPEGEEFLQDYDQYGPSDCIGFDLVSILSFCQGLSGGE